MAYTPCCWGADLTMHLSGLIAIKASECTLSSGAIKRLLRKHSWQKENTRRRSGKNGNIHKHNRYWLVSQCCSSLLKKTSSTRIPQGSARVGVEDVPSWTPHTVMDRGTELTINTSNTTVMMDRPLRWDKSWRAASVAVSKPTTAKGLNCLKEYLIKLSNVFFLYLPVRLEDKKLEGRTTPSVFKVLVPQMKLNIAMTLQQQCPAQSPVSHSQNKSLAQHSASCCL